MIILMQLGNNIEFGCAAILDYDIAQDSLKNHRI